MRYILEILPDEQSDMVLETKPYISVLTLGSGHRLIVWYHSFSETLFTVDELETSTAQGK